MFKLRIPLDRIAALTDRYSDRAKDDALAKPVAAARAGGFLTKSEFLSLCEWKSPRTRPRCAANDEAYIREITALALSPSTSSRLAIESLTLLSGVKWPTASVVLHFCHRDPYPILDFRALWSLTCPVPATYSFPFWSSYTTYTRELARKLGWEMRKLDRALWQYSKDHQKSDA